MGPDAALQAELLTLTRTRDIGALIESCATRMPRMRDSSYLVSRSGPGELSGSAAGKVAVASTPIFITNVIR